MKTDRAYAEMREASRAYAEHLRKIADLEQCIERDEARIEEALRATQNKNLRKGRAAREIFLAHWPAVVARMKNDLINARAQTASLKASHDECFRPYVQIGTTGRTRQGPSESKFKVFAISRREAARQVLIPRPEILSPPPQLLYGIWKTASGKEYMFTRTYAIIYERDSATSIARRVLDTTMTIDFDADNPVVVVKNGCCSSRSGNIRFFDGRTSEYLREKEIETALAFWGIERVPLTDDRRPTIWGEVFVSGRPYPLKPERH